MHQSIMQSTRWNLPSVTRTDWANQISNPSVSISIEINHIDFRTKISQQVINQLWWESYETTTKKRSKNGWINSYAFCHTTEKKNSVNSYIGHAHQKISGIRESSSWCHLIFFCEEYIFCSSKTQLLYKSIHAILESLCLVRKCLEINFKHSAPVAILTIS